MSQVEFLMVFHGVIFSMAIVDLVSHTHDIFTKSYWEYIIWAIALFEIGAQSWYSTFDKMDAIAYNYAHFLVMMLPVIFYFLTIRIFTPPDGQGYKEYFLSKRKSFIGMLFLFSLSGFFSDYILGVEPHFTWMRVGVTALLIPAYFINHAAVRLFPVFVRLLVISYWMATGAL
ncbi:hypothetical protein [Phaeocystidibacter marisrubri]|uniref:Low temperature requirement protein A n=1 Tax=Phaeocystidibacter marisrubri TaxID=1577780 RepID=A0A6L3ZED5_9FLAO|nr:hypothetical protein [Phaeocystidibacter marisrubri]KAB2816195.1 hypothetical protein F8C82_10945 [Phaeocystidibacter marisrubri]GGH67795.1 hypothetical protein GCM10011318_07170 [Phaeocystidibacter marisrubri]